MKNLNKIAAAIISCTLLSAPAAAMSGKKISGVVLAEGSNRPISDAIVVVIWRGFAGITHGRKTCYHTETTKTDSIGRFQTKAWSTGFAMDDLLISNRRVTAVAYKPGYLQWSDTQSEDRKVFLEQFRGTGEQYFSQLRHTLLQDSICFSDADPDGKLYPLFSSVVIDSSPKATTAEDDRVIKAFILLRDEALRKSKGVVQ